MVFWWLNVAVLGFGVATSIVSSVYASEEISEKNLPVWIPGSMLIAYFLASWVMLFWSVIS